MKFTLKALAAVIAFSALAKADYLGTFDMTYDNYKRIELEDCQGYATVTGYPDSLVLRVVGNDNCTRVKVDGKTFIAEEGYFSDTKRLEVTIYLTDDYNSSQVVITSKSGKTQDRLTLVKRNKPQTPVLGDEDWAYLPYCKGYAKFEVENGQANLKLKNISLNNCKAVNVSANGIFKNYELIYENSSFTVPKSMIDYGTNKVVISFDSKYSDRVDNLVLKFRAR